MRNLFPFAVLAICSTSGAALADSGGRDLLVLPPLDERNVLTLTIDGSLNALSIGQTAVEGAVAGHAMTVSIAGDRNGRPSSPEEGPSPLIDGLPWGALSQTGQGNAMSWSVSGSDNLFAAVQSGEGNALQASISGMGNIAAVSQIGNNNAATFSQAGNGNMMSITQTSW